MYTQAQRRRLRASSSAPGRRPAENSSSQHFCSRIREEVGFDFEDARLLTSVLAVAIIFTGGAFLTTGAHAESTDAVGCTTAELLDTAVRTGNRLCDGSYEVVGWACLDGGWSVTVRCL